MDITQLEAIFSFDFSGFFIKKYPNTARAMAVSIRKPNVKP